MREGYSFIYPKNEMPISEWRQRVSWMKQNTASAMFIQVKKWASHDYIWACFSEFDDATLYKLTWEGK